MREHLKMRWYLKIPLGALVSLVTLQTTGAAGQVSRSLRANTQTAETPKKNGALPAPAQPGLPRCPEVDRPAPPPLSPETVHHTVTLSWNPSTSAANAGNQSVGYCLYRSQKPGIPKKISECTMCVQVNSLAIAGTACVDNQVQDGETYHYVVTYVVARANANKAETSPSSNEATAHIPINSKSAKSPSVASYPLCRATTVSK